jgi:putative nucleotide binding protein
MPNTHKTPKEETVIILDFLPNGYPFDKTPLHKKSAIAQAIGTKKFTLLEIVPRKGTHLTLMDEVYIGIGKRDKVHHIKGRLSLDKLTQTAKLELDSVVKELIKKNEKEFLNFFNKAQPLSIRMHSLELLPGVGKKHVKEILEEREIGPFKSFKEMKERVKLMPDPETVIFRRIMLELEGHEKHKLFLD